MLFERNSMIGGEAAWPGGKPSARGEGPAEGGKGKSCKNRAQKMLWKGRGTKRLEKVVNRRENSCQRKAKKKTDGLAHR